MTSEIATALAPTPLGFTRSALFGVSTKDRSYVDREIAIPAAALRNTKIQYTGPALNQHHSLVLQAVLQRSHHCGSSTFTITASELLRAVGCENANDTKQRRRVWGWLRDLTRASISYSTVSHDYSGSLLFEVLRENDTGHIRIVVNPNFSRILDDEVLRNNLQRKASLGSNVLAMWLHDYLASHKHPPHDQVDTLRKLSGSKSNLPQFRQKLRVALEALRKTPDPLVIGWSISGADVLAVKKSDTRVVILPASVKDKLAIKGGVSAAAQQARARRASVVL